jgi:hypothetical protein
MAHVDPETGVSETYLIDLPLEFRQGEARKGAKGYRCFICTDVRGRGEGVVSNGRFYCFANGCYKDVQK